MQCNSYYFALVLCLNGVAVISTIRTFALNLLNSWITQIRSIFQRFPMVPNKCWLYYLWSNFQCWVMRLKLTTSVSSFVKLFIRLFNNNLLTFYNCIQIICNFILTVFPSFFTNVVTFTANQVQSTWVMWRKYNKSHDPFPKVFSVICIITLQLSFLIRVGCVLTVLYCKWHDDKILSYQEN